MSSISLGGNTRIAGSNHLWKHIGWWALFVICAVYGGFALTMGAMEALFRLGVVDGAPLRGTPIVFVLHALSGGFVLISGPLQFNRDMLKSRPTIHRVLGRIHAGTIWFSSVAGLWLVVFFDVSIAAKFALGAVSILWFSTTTIALLYIYRRKVAKHREWMIRSFALSLFFITFSLWVPGLASTSLPHAIAYPLAIFLSWSLNLIVAEIWICRTRKNTHRTGYGNYAISLRWWQQAFRRHANLLSRRRPLLWAFGLTLGLVSGWLLVASLLDRSALGTVVGGTWFVNITVNVLFFDHLLRKAEQP